MIRTMIQIYEVFDVAYLSNSRAQMVYKLARSIRASEDNQYIINEAKQRIAGELNNYGENFC